MSVATEITRIQNAKEDLKTSINAKNDSSHQITNETIDDYSDFVDAIQTGGGTPNLQNKSVTITTNTTTNITADSEYDGLDTVSVTTSVSGGTTPENGVVLADWDRDGYPKTATLYGYTTIWRNFFYSAFATSFYSKLSNIVVNSGVTQLQEYSFYTSSQSYLANISLPNTLTKIDQYSFYGCNVLAITSLPNAITTIGKEAFNLCSALALTSLPSNLTSMGTSAFAQCSNIEISQIPDGVTFISNSTFFNCTKLKKISMANVTGINGTSTSNGSFRSCTGLKQVWIGSAISTSQIQRYSFNGCTALEKIYIDLPRATVESFTNYQYAFMNDTSKTGIIVCNDDSGFINKATFDALVIS